MADEAEVVEEVVEDNPQPAEAATTPQEVSIPNTSAMVQNGEDLTLEAVYDIPIEISVVLGRTSVPINDLLKMGSGAVIELERKIGEAVDVYVNGRIVARGEVVIVEDNIGITMTEIIKLDQD